MTEPTGRKNDTGKARIGLISDFALWQEARVMTFGAQKYAAHNWRGGISWSRLIDACLRHIHAFNSGEDMDPETGLSHLAHARCCLGFLLEYTQTHKELDDRFNLIEAVNDQRLRETIADSEEKPKETITTQEPLREDDAGGPTTEGSKEPSV
jgi:hypothetical protein